MKKSTKEQMNAFILSANNVLKKYNPTELSNSSYTHYINTPIGKLFVRVDDEYDPTYSIYLCFEDANEAHKHYECNPFSGKCNIHKYDAEDAINILSNMLKYMMGIGSRERFEREAATC